MTYIYKGIRTGIIFPMPVQGKCETREDLIREVYALCRRYNRVRLTLRGPDLHEEIDSAKPFAIFKWVWWAD